MKNNICANIDSLEFLRASGFCTFVFLHSAKFETFVLKIKKTKEQRFL